MRDLPLTQAQCGIWFAQQREPSSTAFHCAEFVRIPGRMGADDVRRLRAAVRTAVAETGTLTARITDGAAGDGAHPRQLLGAEWDDPVRVLDLGGEPHPESAARAAMRADAGAPLALDGGRLATAVILLLADETVLYLRAHHIVLDGYGFSALIRRTAALFTADAAGADPAAPPFTALDRVLAQEDAYRASADFAADREYWTGLMRGRAPVSLVEHPLPAARAPLHRRGTLPAAAADGLQRTAREADLAWPEAVLAAAAVYTSAMTGSDEVVLGVPVLARTGPALRAPTTAVNVLPMPLHVDTEADLTALARQVRDANAAARPHQRYRHEDLRRDLALVGGAQRLTGPQVNIKPFGYPLRFAGRHATVHYLEAGPVEDIELTVHTAAPDGALGFDLAANPDLYGADDLEAHHARLSGLVSAFASGRCTGLPARRIPVATGAELRTIAAANDTDHPVDPATLTERLAAQARRTPHAPAVRFRGVQWSYRELDTRANRIARALAAFDLDAGTGDDVSHGHGAFPIVAVALPRSADLVAALLAVLKCGAAYLPVAPENPDERIAYLFSDARPSCVVTDAATAARLPQEAAERAVLVDDPAQVPAHGPDSPPEGPAAGPADPAYVLYTSGSTGAPKGVVVSHGAIVNRLAWMQHAFGLGPHDRVLQKTPCGFDVSVWEFFWPLITGAALVVAEPDGHRDPAYLARVIAEESITTIHFVPSMLEVFLGEPGARACGLRRIVCSGEALGPGLATRAARQLGAPVFNLYGPTEAAVDVSWWRHEPDDPAMPIGLPVWNTRLHVLDPHLRTLPPGVGGELWIAGAQLAEGYLGRAGLTAEKFPTGLPGAPEHRMYRTGDLARRRPDGALEYLGRIDDQVKIRGVRVEPGEAAAALESLDGVGQAAVVAADLPAGLQLVGYVVGDSATTTALDPAALRHAVERALPAAMVPAQIMVLDAMPVTANGKLDRASLPQPGQATGATAPRTPTEQAVCEAFARELGLASSAPTDDFFALGGHSLRAATLVRRLHAELGAEVPVGTVFAAPTPRLLAEVLDDGAQDRSLDVLFPLRRGGGRPVYCIHPAGGVGWGYAALARELPGDRTLTAVQARGLHGGGRLPASIDEMAADYVEAIRSSGDEGPYDLAGWSVGGVIAHAMAVRMQDLGASVRSLTMLDAFPSDQWRGLADPTETDALRAVLTMAGDDPSDLDADGLDRDGVLARLRSSGSALGSLGDTALNAVVDIVGNNARIMREHRHRVFDGDLLFFTAAAPRAEDWLDRDAWLPYITGKVDGHDIDCTHPNLVRGEAVAEVGRVIGPYLADTAAAAPDDQNFG